MANDTLANFFAPEDRKHGEDLFDNDVVSIGSSSDTQVRAYLKDTGAPRVSFTAKDIANPSFQADCTCSKAKKGKLCKHIWSVILKIETSDSDFLACKSTVKKAAPKPETAASLAAKERQTEYRQQIKNQKKAWNKKIRNDKKQARSVATLSYPDDVKVALSYFLKNGFDLSHPLDAETLDTARKTLSRVFHPDKGGTHEEILMLNKNHDIIAAYIGL